jgi:hypothetical protein
MLILIGVMLVGCVSQGAVLPEPINTDAAPQLFVTATQVSTAPPTLDVPLPGQTPTPTVVSGAALTLPSPTPYPDTARFSIGLSVEGRDLWAWQFGEGPHTVVLVGGMHGGFEGNTVELAEELTDYFQFHPTAILPGVKLVIIPSANPDGFERGSGIEGRFNANGVDLNRNWGCEWEPTALLQDVEVDPGPRPFSEPESLALRAYFITKPPDAVIFYHSAVGEIFLGQCGDKLEAEWLGDLLEEATGYTHQEDFTYYEVSGDASNWLAERGIPAAIIELYTKDETDYRINLAGVMALQCHFALIQAGQTSASLSDPILEQYCT